MQTNKFPIFFFILLSCAFGIYLGMVFEHSYFRFKRATWLDRKCDYVKSEVPKDGEFKNTEFNQDKNPLEIQKRRDMQIEGEDKLAIDDFVRVDGGDTASRVSVGPLQIDDCTLLETRKKEGEAGPQNFKRIWGDILSCVDQHIC